MKRKSKHVQGGDLLDLVNESLTRRNEPRQTADNSRGEAFRRDAPTLLCYAVLAAFAFWRYGFGLAPALLRAEMHFSYTLIGVYSALWSVGTVLVGVSFAAMARQLPRTLLLWGSAAGATAGAGLFAATHTIALTLVGTGVLGFAGTILLTCTQVILSDRHGGHRDRALTEANIGASACAVLTPLLLGLLQGTPGGWRVAMSFPAFVLAGLYLRWRHQPLWVAASEVRTIESSARLSLCCWLLAALSAGSMAVEFCMVYFGAELLASVGLRTAQAAAAMSVFYLGSLGGRIGGAWLTRRAGRSVRLLCISLAVTAAGFLLFWLASLPALMIAGLFLCGLGVANLWPLSLALTLAAAPENGDAASARTQLLGGAFVIAAPSLLGSLSDHLGLHAAFTVEPVLIGICTLVLFAGLRLRRAAAEGMG
jgi:MFS family permease